MRSGWGWGSEAALVFYRSFVEGGWTVEQTMGGEVGIWLELLERLRRRNFC